MTELPERFMVGGQHHIHVCRIDRIQTIFEDIRPGKGST